MCKIAIFSTKDAKLVESILKCNNNEAKVKVIITNKPDSPVIGVAKRHNIKYRCFDNKEYESREAHEWDIVEFLRGEGIQLIVFAHYMRLVTEFFVNNFRKKIVNVHPSLLPHFKGAYGYRDAFDAGVQVSGCTLHYVDEGIDTGDIIMQKTVPRFEKDSFERFRDRVHKIECVTITSFINSLVV